MRLAILIIAATLAGCGTIPPPRSRAVADKSGAWIDIGGELFYCAANDDGKKVPSPQCFSPRFYSEEKRPPAP